MISVAPGTYRERLRITKPGIRIRSPYDDPSQTVVVFDASAGTAGGTLKSATVEVLASDFAAENLTFANDCNATHPQLPQGSQAVALKVTGDRAVFRNVRVLGNQDTLYVGSTDCEGPNGRPCTPARAYFEGCHVEGNVDFIFGDGKAVLRGLQIHSTPHEVGFVTAQGKHYPEQDSAFVFHRCRLTAEPGVKDVWLGRPWRDFASVVFLEHRDGRPRRARGLAGVASRRDEPARHGSLRREGLDRPGRAPGGRDPHARALAAGEADRFARRPFLAGPDGWDPISRFREAAPVW